MESVGRLASLGLLDCSVDGGVSLTEAGRLFVESQSLNRGELDRIVEEVERRADAVRKAVMAMITDAETGHLSSSLSCVEILCALYFAKMRHDPENPSMPDRDRLVLSKGHAAPALYAVLAECGYFRKDELVNFRDIDGILQGHPEAYIPGVETPSGSLGQGLSVAVGMALSAKMDGKPYRVYVLLGDGELNEGQVWEAAMTASHLGLDNLVAIVDRNRSQLCGETEAVKSLEPLAERWRSFGWRVLEIDGNDVRQILGALEEADRGEGRPTVIIAHTRVKL